MSKRWMSWMVVAAMTFGGAGFLLGGAVLGAHAASAPSVASTVASRPLEHSTPTALATTTRPTLAPTPSLVVPTRPAPSLVTGELSIRRMQVTSGIDGREPIDHPTTFDDGEERVYAFVDVSNPSGEPRALLVTFENGQRSTGHVTLQIPAHSARFRTWAWTRLSRSPGEWTAMIRDEDGAVLASDEFEIR